MKVDTQITQDKQHQRELEIYNKEKEEYDKQQRELELEKEQRQRELEYQQEQKNKLSETTVICGTGTKLINGVCEVIQIEDEISSKLVNCDDKMLKIVTERGYSDQRNLSDTILTNCNLENYDIGYWNLSGADLSGANLKGAHLRGADLTGADLRGADLTGADLSGADLTGANLRGIHLTGTDLSGADLTGANFRYTTLDDVDLSGANLFLVDWHEADLSGADLTNTQLESQHEPLIDQEQLEELFLEKYTLLDSIKSNFLKLDDEQKLLKQKLENLPSISNQDYVDNGWNILKENQVKIDQFESLINGAKRELDAGRNENAEKYLESIEIKQDIIEKNLKLIQININNVEGGVPSEDSADGIYKSTEEEGGGCLIATATYGSEMAPQVQQLRELRDNQLLQTESGTAFMGAFNDIYYSFSPIIADMEREHPLFKEAVKIAITPMISTLSLMENAETESEVLGIGISVIALTLGMYLGIPAIVVVGIRRII